MKKSYLVLSAIFLLAACEKPVTYPGSFIPNPPSYFSPIRPFIQLTCGGTYYEFDEALYGGGLVFTPTYDSTGISPVSFSLQAYDTWVGRSSGNPLGVVSDFSLTWTILTDSLRVGSYTLKPGKGQFTIAPYSGAGTWRLQGPISLTVNITENDYRGISGLITGTLCNDYTGYNSPVAAGVFGYVPVGD